ncbi:hypothetical protein AB1Y20_007942 [Prymnesium parvum]|uniref:Peroxin/Ferlin domain-containing protein n=1 Tax=Prymnesium parvum TaxID=97485 RepID=A0AB34IV68_PRYPA
MSNPLVRQSAAAPPPAVADETHLRELLEALRPAAASRSLHVAFELPQTLAEFLFKLVLPTPLPSAAEVNASLARLLHGTDAQRRLWLFETFAADGVIGHDAMSQLVLTHVAASELISPGSGAAAALPLLELVDSAFPCHPPAFSPPHPPCTRLSARQRQSAAAALSVFDDADDTEPESADLPPSNSASTRSRATSDEHYALKEAGKEEEAPEGTEKAEVEAMDKPQGAGVVREAGAEAEAVDGGKADMEKREEAEAEGMAKAEKEEEELGGELAAEGMEERKEETNAVGQRQEGSGIEAEAEAAAYGKAEGTGAEREKREAEAGAVEGVATDAEGGEKENAKRERDGEAEERKSAEASEEEDADDADAEEEEDTEVDLELEPEAEAAGGAEAEEPQDAAGEACAPRPKREGSVESDWAYEEASAARTSRALRLARASLAALSWRRAAPPAAWHPEAMGRAEFSAWAEAAERKVRRSLSGPFALVLRRCLVETDAKTVVARLEAWRPARRQSVAVVEERYENQRWAPRGGFSARHLLAAERGPFSDGRGGQSSAALEDGWRLADGWAWADAPILDPLAEGEGWEYAPSWGAAVWKPQRSSLCFVRRRKWVRVRVPSEALVGRGGDRESRASLCSAGDTPAPLGESV